MFGTNGPSVSDFSISVRQHRSISVSRGKKFGVLLGEVRADTYTLLQIPLHNREFPLVAHILHDEPAQRLFILGVNLARFDELVLELRDAVCVVLCIKVHDDSVDHD